jgi:hypothetical protein
LLSFSTSCFITLQGDLNVIHDEASAVHAISLLRIHSY